MLYNKGLSAAMENSGGSSAVFVRIKLFLFYVEIIVYHKHAPFYGFVVDTLTDL